MKITIEKSVTGSYVRLVMDCEVDEDEFELDNASSDAKKLVVDLYQWELAALWAEAEKALGRDGA